MALQPQYSSIPSFYRIFFSFIDPLVALSGVYLNYFDGDTVITSIFPPSHAWSRITPSHTLLLEQSGGFLLMIVFLQVFLLRHTKDLGVWKLFEASLLITDFGMFYSFWNALSMQGRLEPGSWRVEEWGNVGITGFVTAVRILFLMGIGLGRQPRAGTKKST